MGADAKRRMALIINDLRRAGISADMSFGDRGLKGAMKGANRAGAKVALVLGDQELAAGTVAVKDLVAHEQHDAEMEKAVDAVRRLLAD